MCVKNTEKLNNTNQDQYFSDLSNMYIPFKENIYWQTFPILI